MDTEHQENDNELHSEIGPYMRGKHYYMTYLSNPWFKLFRPKPVICDKYMFKIDESMFKNSSDCKKYLEFKESDDERLNIGEHIEWRIEFMSHFKPLPKIYRKFLDPYFRTYCEAFSYIEEYILENKLNLDKEMIEDEI